METWSAFKFLLDVHFGRDGDPAGELLVGDGLAFLQENFDEENDSDTASITSSYGSPPPSPPGSPPHVPLDPPDPPESPPRRDNPPEILIVEPEQEEV